MSRSSAPRLEIVRAGEGHAAALAEFIRQVWDERATADSVLASRAAGAARNVAEPGVAPPTWIAVRDEKVLGYVTTIPIRLWDGSREWPAYWIKGLMVLPEFRSGPIGYLVLKAALASLRRTGALAVAAPARRLFDALGYSDLGPVPNWIRPIAPHRILRRLDLGGLGLSRLPRWAPALLRAARASGLGTLAGWVGGAAIQVAARALRLPALGLHTGPFDPAESERELGELWQDTRVGFPSAVARNPEYLIPRYPDAPGGPYRWVAARDRGRLAGVAIMRRPRTEGDERLKGIRVATLADVVYPPARPEVGLALLGAAEGVAREFGADAILATASAPPLAALLRRQLYLPLGGNVHFLFRDAGGDGATFGDALADWWLLRGDGGADEVF